MAKVKTSAIWLAAAVCAMAAGPGCKGELRLRPEALPAAAVQAAYAASICVSNPGNPIAGFEVESGELPEGLRLAHARGEDCARIEGTPTRPGRYRFAVAAWEFGTMRSGRTGRVAYVLDIAPAPGHPRGDTGRGR